MNDARCRRCGIEERLAGPFCLRCAKAINGHFTAIGARAPYRIPQRLREGRRLFNRAPRRAA